MKGIKAYTHLERQELIRQLIPLIKDKFGENLIALAVEGSFARNEDLKYSDLEIIAFLKEVDETRDLSIRGVIQSQLVQIIPETKEGYINKYLEVSDVWYASGAGKLLPIINEAVIQEINDFKPDNLQEKCLKQVKKRWINYTEITAKLLSNIQARNTDGVALIFSDVVKELLILLSFLNTTPYKTLGSYTTQAKNFPIKPAGFNELIDLFITGKNNFERRKKSAVRVFEELEQILETRGIVKHSETIQELLSL